VHVADEVEKCIPCAQCTAPFVMDANNIKDRSNHGSRSLEEDCILRRVEGGITMSLVTSETISKMGQRPRRAFVRFRE